MQIQQTNITPEIIDGIDISTLPEDVKKAMRKIHTYPRNKKVNQFVDHDNNDRNLENKGNWTSVCINHSNPKKYKTKQDWINHLIKCEEQYHLRLVNPRKSILHLYQLRYLELLRLCKDTANIKELRTLKYQLDMSYDCLSLAADLLKTSIPTKHETPLYNSIQFKEVDVDSAIEYKY